MLAWFADDDGASLLWSGITIRALGRCAQWKRMESNGKLRLALFWAIFYWRPKSLRSCTSTYARAAVMFWQGKDLQCSSLIHLANKKTVNDLRPHDLDPQISYVYSSGRCAQSVFGDAFSKPLHGDNVSRWGSMTSKVSMPSLLQVWTTHWDGLYATFWRVRH